MSGFDSIDSIVVNAHKAMLTGFDCSMFWVGDRRWLYAALSLDPNLEPYLQNAATSSGRVIDFKNWQVPLGRRFRSLKLWFLIRSFGLSGIRRHLQLSLDHANYVARLLNESGYFEVLPTSFSTCVFRLKNGSNDQNKTLVEIANGTGTIFLISTVCLGKVYLRLACGGIDMDYGNLESACQTLSMIVDKYIIN